MITVLWTGLNLWRRVGLVVAILGVLYAAFEVERYRQRQIGAESERQKQITASHKALVEREKTNEETNRKSDADLCVNWAGGVWVDGKCVER